ncbi:MAG: hypothetical protein JWR26_4592 [Pedosphaera sp.]|nr:hypothetical protein [Pedosphaera sp.]
MNVNYSSYAGCLRTATMGGRGERDLQQEVTEGTEFYHRPRVRDRCGQDKHRWDFLHCRLGIRKDSRSNHRCTQMGLRTAHVVGGVPPCLDFVGLGVRRLRCESGVGVGVFLGVGRGACARPLSRHISPSLGVSRSVSPFSDLFFWSLQTATKHTATMERGRLGSPGYAYFSSIYFASLVFAHGHRIYRMKTKALTGVFMVCAHHHA